LHRRDLDLLRRDDLLGKLTGQRVSAINQHETRHVDGALMMRDHHRQEIAPSPLIGAAFMASVMALIWRCISVANPSTA